MLSFISFVAGVHAHTPLGLLLCVLDLDSVETQKAVAAFVGC